MHNKISILIQTLMFLIVSGCNDDPEKQKHFDAVCGMEITDYSVTYTLKGHVYHFCTEGCKEKFKSKTSTYVKDYNKFSVDLKEEADYSDSLNSGLISIDNLKGSPRRHTQYSDEQILIDIDYGAPGVKGRIIWGGLVPYKQVWVAGAHYATSISFSSDVSIDGQIIQKGKYALFAIPGKEKWIVMLNRNFNQHLTDDYKAEEDVVRVETKPQKIRDIVQRLSYEIHSPKNRTEIEVVLKWERLAIVLPISKK